MIKVVLDAMGGDNAPHSNVLGAISALNKSNNISLVLTGNKDKIEGILKDKIYDKSRLSIVDATEVIETSEAPVLAIKSKKDSSLVKALQMLKNKDVDAFVSAGNTGAVLVGATVIVGRSKGVERAGLAPLIPTEKGVSLLIDCGANVDARASHLIQFAKMGSLYMENLLRIKNPKVAIVNIGAEEEKGNALVKEAFPLLKELKDINFIGSIEARDIPKGYADVIVSEAFVGNVILKLYEGLGLSLISKVKKAMTSNIIVKLGALLVKDSLKKEFKTFDLSEYGGAPLIGLKSLVVKAHGSAGKKEICNTILQCEDFLRIGLDKLIENTFNN